MSLPIERILWAPTNDAHWNHLHVVGEPRYKQSELPTNGIWTPAIGTIFDALDAEFGPGEHFIIDPDAAWTHMGVYNPRYIAGTTIWSQHAGANAIDIGPYYGVKEQQVFYDFLTQYSEKGGEVMSLPINAESHKEEIRHVQEMLAVAASGKWDFQGAVKNLAIRAGTGDPEGQQGVHVNGRMYTQLLEEFIGRKSGTSTVDEQARSIARHANSRIDDIAEAAS